jgi:hypothetical protein
VRTGRRRSVRVKIGEMAKSQRGKRAKARVNYRDHVERLMADIAVSTTPVSRCFSMANLLFAVANQNPADSGILPMSQLSENWPGQGPRALPPARLPWGRRESACSLQLSTVGAMPVV